MGIQLPESLLTMKFLVIAALCATAMGRPQGRKLRAEEHWRPAQDRDLSKYQPRHPTVAAGTGDVDMDRINKVAAELRGRHFSNHKDKGTPRAEGGIEGPAYKGKIVGGEEATPHTWPWQVALFIDNAWFCGGSIISENYVLTAAHCAGGASYFDVMAGAHNVREGNEAGRVEITSYNGWTHPQWDSHTLSNDLALIELPSPLPMSSIISSSCLPFAGQIPSVGSMMTITGWGKPSDSAGGISPVLREVRDIPVMSNKDCNDVYGIVGDGSSVLTPQEDVDHTMETLVAPWSRRTVQRAQDRNGSSKELCPSELPLDVRQACLLDSPGPNTTWTGSTARLDVNSQILILSGHSHQIYLNR